MRLFAVSSASLGLLAVLAPVSTWATDKKGKLRVKKPAAGVPGAAPATTTAVPASNPAPAFDFESATVAEQVTFFRSKQEWQKAVEHYLAAPADQQAVPEAGEAFRHSMYVWACNFLLNGQKLEDLGIPEQVRILFSRGDFDQAISLYESCEDCKVDSKATACYFASKLALIPPADFETATLETKLKFLVYVKHFQTAVEMFLAAPAEEQKDLAAVWQYTKSIQEFARLPSNPDAKWEDFTEAEKVRAFWQAGKFDDAIAVYEASAECKTDSKATAAYLDVQRVKAGVTNSHYTV